MGIKRWVVYKYRIWRSQRFWKQFASSGATVSDQLEFAKDNLTSGRLDTLWM